MSNDVMEFRFGVDTFGFANELLWEYHFDPGSNHPRTIPRKPRPRYTHRCFVLVRAARQFFYHATFIPGSTPPLDADFWRPRVRAILGRNPRVRRETESLIEFPGYASLHEFSAAHKELVRCEGGGAWRSYVLRSHWRMVFPISRPHQANTAQRLQDRVRQGKPPIVHLVTFPQLTINHGMLLYEVEEHPSELRFLAYDPNQPETPAVLSYDRGSRTFALPRNLYWIGGKLDVIEIYRNWWF